MVFVTISWKKQPEEKRLHSGNCPCRHIGHHCFQTPKSRIPEFEMLNFPIDMGIICWDHDGPCVAHDLLFGKAMGIGVVDGHFHMANYSHQLGYT